MYCKQDADYITIMLTVGFWNARLVSQNPVSIALSHFSIGVRSQRPLLCHSPTLALSMDIKYLIDTLLSAFIK